MTDERIGKNHRFLIQKPENTPSPAEKDGLTTKKSINITAKAASLWTKLIVERGSATATKKIARIEKISFFI